MLAVHLPRYGDPQVLVFRKNLPPPSPQPDQVLVEIHAVGLNPFDLKLVHGTYQNQIPLDLPVVPGGDFAGVVASTGDPVYGTAQVVGGGSGALAEYAVVNAESLAPQPEIVDVLEAAALPLAGVGAVQALEEVIQLKPGQTILIHGGAGGIGHLAIQLAKALDAYVATTVSAPDLNFARRLGADLVIDYRRQPFTGLVKNYDAVLDTVGGEITSQSLTALKTGGILVTLVGQPDQAIAEQKGLIAVPLQVRTTSTRLNRLAQWVDQGKLKVHLDKVFPLAETSTAFNHLATRSQGKVVVRVR